METHICKNCGNRFTGKYCNNCGQKANIGRINFGYILHDLTHSVFHIEKGFLYTIKQLILHPGITIREYLLGKRINLFKPISFAFVISVLCTILFNTLHLRTFATGFTIEDFEKAFGLMGHYYYGIILIFHVPYFSVLCWLAFRDTHYNYAENLILNAYLAGQVLVLRILTIPFLLLFNSLEGNTITYWILIVIIVLYQAWAYYQFYETRNKILLGIRALAVTVIGFITFQLMFSWVVNTLIMRHY